MAEEKRQFPTEMVNLPSRGALYSKETSLSGGEVEVKYMTAKEEDILTSQNLIRKGLVIDKLLESLVVDASVNLDTMLIGDKNALMVAARILGYGKDYNFEVNCPSCNEKVKDSFDLTKMKDKKIDHSIFKSGVNEFDFELPATKRKITYKLLTQKDERDIDEELKALKKVAGNTDNTAEVTTRLKKAIISVDSETNRSKINSFVDNEFLSRDSLAFREHLAEITPDVDMRYNYTCPSCDHEEEMTVPMTVQFFWPSTRT